MIYIILKQDIWRLKDHYKYFEEPASKIKTNAWLMADGRVILQEFSSKKKHQILKGRIPIAKKDFAADQSVKSYDIVIDPSGYDPGLAMNWYLKFLRRNRSPM